ncbi:MAG: putative methyltransferase [Phenylobacterium sp.]
MAKSLPLLIAASLMAASTLMAPAASAAESEKKEASAFSKKIELAMKAESRSEKDKERDGNRMPVKTLEFFGIEEDMKVLELIPGRGWYSRLLAPALAEKGDFYIGVGSRRVKEAKEKKEEVFQSIKIVAEDTKFSYNEELKGTEVDNVDLQGTDYDAILTFRNYHNLTEVSRMKLNGLILTALKPGGIYGVVDHTRRHMQEDDNENGRRVDPVLAIKEIQQAGFEFVDYSTLHYRPDDELRYEVGRKTVTGNTDRFTLLFKKPM